MSGFSFVVDYDDARTPEQNATRRGPDYLVRVPNGHSLFGIGPSYFRQDGAAVPPSGAAAVVAVIPDCMPLGLLEGLVCDAVAGPPNNTALYGTHCFQPEFLGRAVDLAVSGLGEEVSDIGVFIGLIRSLKENGGLVAQPVDLVALAPHPAVGPLPAAAFAAVENPDDLASWTAPFALSSSAFSDLADEDGFMGAYAALHLASGVAGITAERRGEPFTAVARLLRDVGPRVGINSVGAWARDSIRSSFSFFFFFSSSPWPPALADKGVYLDMNRALHDLGARASFFTGDANQRLRIFRTRSESLIASLPAFSAVVGSAKKALAYDLAMQLAMRIDPSGDLSSLELWCRADHKLASYIAVLTLTVNDPVAATAQVIDYMDARSAQSGSGGVSFGGAVGPVGGGGGGSGVRARTVEVVDVVSGPKVAGPDGLLSKLPVAATISPEQMILVAAGSKLQPVLKFLFFDEKIPVEHEVFNLLMPVLLAIPTYFALNVSVGNDRTVSGPAMDRSEARAKTFKFFDTFVLALKKGDFVACASSSVAEFYAWHVAVGVKRPGAVDFLDAAVRYPEYAGFMDRIFSCLGYDRSTAPAGFVLPGAAKTIGDVITEMALFKRREPRDGMHSSRAIAFLLDVAKMAGVEFVRFLSVGSCSGMLPSFAVDTWSPCSRPSVEAVSKSMVFVILMTMLRGCSALPTPRMQRPHRRACRRRSRSRKWRPMFARFPVTSGRFSVPDTIIVTQPMRFRRAPSPRFRPRLLPALRGLIQLGLLRHRLWLHLSSRRRFSTFLLVSAASSAAVLRLLLHSSLPHRLRPLRRPLPPSSAHFRPPSLTPVEAVARAAAARAAARAAKAKAVVAVKTAAVNSPAALAKLPCHRTAGPCR